MPAVSILVPAFNAEATLSTALESLRRQTFTDWECVICDDGSADATAAIAETYARADRRYRVLSRSHSGLVPALNWGVEHCRGTYVARFDADDIAHRDRLRLQHDFLSVHPEYGGVGCGVRIFPRAELTAGRRDYETWLNSPATEEDIRRDRFVECPLAHPTLFLRRDLMLAHGYRETPWAEDYDLILRIFGAGHRLSTVPRRLLFWRESPSRLSRCDGRYALESFTRCRAHFLATDWLFGAKHYGLWGYGSTGRALVRALKDCGRYPAYIVELHPGRIGQTIQDAPVVHPSQLARVRLPGDRIIVSVAGLRQRREVRQRARELGFIEGVDFVCAA